MTDIEKYNDFSAKLAEIKTQLKDINAEESATKGPMTEEKLNKKFSNFNKFLDSKVRIDARLTIAEFKSLLDIDFSKTANIKYINRVYQYEKLIKDLIKRLNNSEQANYIGSLYDYLVFCIQDAAYEMGDLPFYKKL